MLDQTKTKLDSYFRNDPQQGLDGQLREIDNVTRIDMREIDRLMAMYKAVAPDASIETGMAYGFSTIAMLDFLEESGRGHHYAIDPTQDGKWHGIALRSIEQLGFSHRLTWIKARSDQAFIRLIGEAQRVQFVFLDGVQFFDGIITDFVLADQLLDLGGLIVFNQSWMPGGRAARAFIANNMENYKIYPVTSGQFFAFQKTAADSRPWDHFVPFDGSGRRDDEREPSKGLLQKLFGKGASANGR